MEVLTAERMRVADRHAIEELGIAGLILMENAGRLVAHAVVERLRPPDGAHVVVVAGRGNNGGDGFVAARHLASAGAFVEVWLVGATMDALTGDAATMARAFAGPGGRVREIGDDAAWERAAPSLAAADVVVDALFGTGLARAAEGLHARAIEAVNDAGLLGALVVAVDLPSGLSGSSPAVPGPAVQADLTVTFARPKPPHLLPPAEPLCGDVLVVDIGIPAASIAAAETDLHWVTRPEAAELVPERDEEDHKGRFGHVAVVGGSVGKAGAAALAGLAALRSGAGLVTVAAPAAVRGEVAAAAAELMTAPLDGQGGSLAEADAERALELAARTSVLALGPGVGRDPGAAACVRRLVAASPVPVVLDADGLNAFEDAGLEALAERDAPLVITPHPGEAARLAGVSSGEIQSDRVGWARRLAARARAICVLKGYRTIVADPEGRAFINSTGNPGLASGGTGDVLTGLVAGLVAQGCDELDAALLGAYLHGLAADLAVAAGETEPTLLASGVIAALPDAYRALEPLAEDSDADDGPA